MTLTKKLSVARLSLWHWVQVLGLLLGAGLLAFLYLFMVPDAAQVPVAIVVALVAAFVEMPPKSNTIPPSLSTRAYVVGLALGLGAVSLEQPFAPNAGDDLIGAVRMAALIFTASGLLAGLLMPRVGWKVGMLTVLPRAGVLLLSVLFAGYLQIFFTVDALPLVAALVGAFGGGALGSLVVRKVKHSA